MKLKINGFLTLLVVLATQITFAQDRSVSGTVSDNAGLPIPGASVLIKGTKTGTQTDANGKYTIKADENETLVISYIGMASKQVSAKSSVVNVKLTDDAVQLEGVVVTALGIKRSEKALPYSAQTVAAKELNISQSVDVKGALSGKIAGIQLNGQAGSKLGSTGKIRIRGAISLTGDDDALYVLDGVPVDVDNIDVDNIESVTVLKGPNATALYGQRAVYGVIQLISKKGNKKKLSIDINSSTSFEKVAYLPKYQNEYGQGYVIGDVDAHFANFDFAAGGDNGAYPAEWAEMNGKRYLTAGNNYADESWGPKFDGLDYLPWYSWWKGSPYFGKTEKYVAQPNNIKNFYDTGITKRNSISVSGGNEKYTARLSVSNLIQNGITPDTGLKKNFLNTFLSYNISDKLKVDFMFNYTTGKIKGEFDDSYSNQTSGSFNSWFGRQIDTDKLRELKNLKTPDGYSTSWNWWGPEAYTNGGSYKKPAFWYNSYTYLNQFDFNRKTENLVFSVNPTYKFNDKLSLTGSFSRNQKTYSLKYYFPTSLSFSAAPDLYNAWQNAFGISNTTNNEDNFDARVNYDTKFNNFTLTSNIGASVRSTSIDIGSTLINPNSKIGGLVLPDVYRFSNASITPIANTYLANKEVRSIYAIANLEYKKYLFLDVSARRDWSSAMPANANGNTTGSIGSSFIFSELLEKNGFLTFGKFRTGYAVIGSDATELALNPNYNLLNAKPYNGNSVALFNKTLLVDPALKYAKNASVELGLDLKFLKNRISLNTTYYSENRKNEILNINVPNSTGSYYFLTNAGETKRSGIELSLSGDVIKSDNEGFKWNSLINFAKNKTIVVSIREGLSAINGPGGADDWDIATVTQQEGKEWGQIRGSAILKNKNGLPVLNSDGLYEIETNHDYGSVLPNFTGGFINQFSYKGLSLIASVDFQNGGKFFSLSETWGTYSGLLEDTAAMNDKGKNVREDVAAGGGVHVTGVDTDGVQVNKYVDAHSYFQQFKSNNIAEPFIHDASYIKLRDISLSYTIKGSKIKNIFESATIGIVGRNLWLIAVSKDNKNNWDPSEMSGGYGESGQLPGTKGYGLNVKLTF